VRTQTACRAKSPDHFNRIAHAHLIRQALHTHDGDDPLAVTPGTSSGGGVVLPRPAPQTSVTHGDSLSGVARAAGPHKILRFAVLFVPVDVLNLDFAA
jgi:hypothetical protein